jgi:hypothetical protein
VIKHSRYTIIGARSTWSYVSIHRETWVRYDDSTEPTPTIFPWTSGLVKKRLVEGTEGKLNVIKKK